MRRSNLGKQHRKANAGKKASAKDSNTEQVEVSGESEGVATKPVKLGAKRALREALKDELSDKGAKNIVAALVKRTIEGDVRSSEMLMTLMVRKKDEDKAGEKKKRSGPSLADLLASEPEWVDPEPESTSEVGMGGREPENSDS